MLIRCVHYLSSNVFMLKHTKKNSLSFQSFYRVYLYLSKWLVWFMFCRNLTLFPVREHSEHRCSLEFVMHCEIFQGANVPVHWKDFVIDTALSLWDWLPSGAIRWIAVLVLVLVSREGAGGCRMGITAAWRSPNGGGNSKIYFQYITIIILSNILYTFSIKLLS